MTTRMDRLYQSGAVLVVETREHLPVLLGAPNWLAYPTWQTTGPGGAGFIEEAERLLLFA